MIFTLFKDRRFEVLHPEALIEAYYFQSDFYEKYDRQRPRGDKSLEFVRFIGARIEKTVLNKCKTEINRHKDFDMFTLSLDSFLEKTPEERDYLAFELGEITRKLVKIPRVGFSKATKVLHTRYPEIIPMIDNPLQREYKDLRRGWDVGDWGQLFKDYYENFLVKETYNNLREIHGKLSFLGLTKVRVFDILWWSFLKSKKLKGVSWETIKPTG